MKRFKYDACEYDKGRREENIPFWVSETIRIANLDSSSMMLDLGCGTGSYALLLKEKTLGRIHALDPSREMVKVGLAKSSSVPIDWICGVAERIPFRDKDFDCILSSQVWHHIQDRFKAAKECYRVLKHNSPLIIRAISHDQWRDKTVCAFFPEILPSQIKAHPSMMAFKEYLGNAGFRNIETIPYRLERHTYPEEFIEAARKKLWSMFKYVSEENLKKGIAKLKSLIGQPIRNDELITLVIGWKS